MDGGHAKQLNICAPCGEREEEDDRYHPPSDTTCQRVLQQVDARAFASLIGAWPPTWWRISRSAWKRRGEFQMSN